MKVRFARHAQGANNLENPVEEPADAPLTSLGREETVAFAGTVDQPPDLIVVSRFLRSPQTVDPLLKKFPGIPVEAWEVHENQLISPNRSSKMSNSDRKKERKSIFLLGDLHYLDGPHAESFQMILERALRNKIRLERLAYKLSSIVVISHGGFMAALKKVLTEADFMPNLEWARENYINNNSIKNCEGFTFEFENGKWTQIV